MSNMKLPKKYSGVRFLEGIRQCAFEGMTMVATVRELEIEDKAIFSHYEKPKEFYMRGRDELAKKLVATIIHASDSSYNDRKLLAEKMDIFSEPFTLHKEVKDQASARDAMSQAISMFTEGRISADTLKAVTSALNGFIESINQSKLAEDILELRRLIKERK